jgi:hypothetical protein
MPKHAHGSRRHIRVTIFPAVPTGTHSAGLTLMEAVRRPIAGRWEKGMVRLTGENLIWTFDL